MTFLRLTLVVTLAAFLPGCESAAIKSIQQDFRTIFQPAFKKSVVLRSPDG